MKNLVSKELATKLVSAPEGEPEYFLVSGQGVIFLACKDDNEIGMVSDRPIKFVGKDAYILIGPNVEGVDEKTGQPIKRVRLVFGEKDKADQVAISGTVTVVEDVNGKIFQRVFSSANPDAAADLRAFLNVEAPTLYDELYDMVAQGLGRARAAKAPSKASEEIIAGGTVVVTSAQVLEQNHDVKVDEPGVSDLKR